MIEASTSPWVRGAAPLLVLFSAIGSGIFLGAETAILVLAAGVMLLAILLLWLSVQNLATDTDLSLEDALRLATPKPEEEEKRSLLRALKDLEYERSVGKINDEDYAALAQRYRTRAKELIATLDRELAPGRARAEALLKAKLVGTDAATAKPEAAPEPEPTRTVAAEPGPRASAAEPERLGNKLKCQKCGTANEIDARFCKSCGEKMQPDTAAEAQ